jgi:hypothetical protein
MAARRPTVAVCRPSDAHARRHSARCVGDPTRAFEALRICVGHPTHARARARGHVAPRRSCDVALRARDCAARPPTSARVARALSLGAVDGLVRAFARSVGWELSRYDSTLSSRPGGEWIF